MLRLSEIKCKHLTSLNHSIFSIANYILMSRHIGDNLGIIKLGLNMLYLAINVINQFRYHDKTKLAITFSR